MSTPFIPRDQPGFSGSMGISQTLVDSVFRTLETGWYQTRAGGYFRAPLAPGPLPGLSVRKDGGVYVILLTLQQPVEGLTLAIHLKSESTVAYVGMPGKMIPMWQGAAVQLPAIIRKALDIVTSPGSPSPLEIPNTPYVLSMPPVRTSRIPAASLERDNRVVLRYAHPYPQISKAFVSVDMTEIELTRTHIRLGLQKKVLSFDVIPDPVFSWN